MAVIGRKLRASLYPAISVTCSDITVWGDYDDDECNFDSGHDDHSGDHDDDVDGDDGEETEVTIIYDQMMMIPW